MFATSSNVSRRRFLQTTSALSATLLAGRVPAADKADPYGGFKLGLQSYTLRGYDVETALQHTQEFGLHYWEAYPKHVPLTTVPAEVQKQKDQLSQYGVKLLSYGVLNFDADETTARKYFDYAKAHGMLSISANPKKDAATFDLLDKLVEEYRIPIAIHNHGPKALYDKVSDVVEWTKDRHPLIGACIDTGHYLRSDEDPVQVIELLGPRVFGVHLKDVRTIPASGGKPAEKIFTIIGEGDLDIAGVLSALKKLKYDRSVSVEYEENMKNPLADVAICLENVRKAVGKVKG